MEVLSFTMMVNFRDREENYELSIRILGMLERVLVST